MYVCRNCEQPINSASVVCPYCGANQSEPVPGETPKSAKKRSAVKLAVAIAIVVLGIWGIIWFALPLRFENPRPAAEKSAIASLRALQKDLATYQNGAGSFPSTLETLGQPAVQAAQQAMSGGYALRYTPGQIDADGNAHSYSLYCRAEELWLPELLHGSDRSDACDSRQPSRHSSGSVINAQ